MAAAQAREAALAVQHAGAISADRALAEVVTGAYTATSEAIAQLGALTVEVDNRARDAIAIDTPLGAREFQRFLIARQREVIAVVNAAHRDAAANAARLRSARDGWARGDAVSR